MGQRPAQSVSLALCLGGFDPSGGAGILRDVITLSSFGIHPMALRTAETVQNGEGCLGIAPPEPDPMAQLEALLPHLRGAWGLKVGMMALPPRLRRELLGRLQELGPRFRIWDPILGPTRGVPLHSGETLLEMAGEILPAGGWIVSPNWVEAEALGRAAGARLAEPGAMVQPLLDAGAEAVWMKGGHREGAVVEDLWITPAGVKGLGPRVRQPGSIRGTGCALASAWLALRLLGRESREAALEASRWLDGRRGSSAVPGSFGRPTLPPGGAA
ncbi:MAG: bifunctional hydroxymethylpyrimidine kinase/phosphomethylpyrimidine kinase [Acidobacteria bacterium]|nr:bifunctional hydroxymethylpyrimidine kinase/phosphomethylpyrimidine kinase [Acidobacteriota bacterium]